MQATKPFKRNQILLLTSLGGLILAQASGYWINQSMPIESTRQILGPLYFTHVRNLGGVFGLAQGKGWIFMLLSLVVLSCLGWYVVRTSNLSRLEYFCYGMIISGGLSNILDRIFYGSVIDFIDIHGIPYWTYIFNTADVMIHVGIWPLLLSGFFTKTTSHTEPRELPESSK